MTSIARISAWLISAVTLVLTVGPPGLRPVAPVPHVFEHFAIFLLVGGAFALGYPRNRFYLAVAALPCIAGLELLQLFAPGRHARLADFIVNAIGAYAGIALVHWFRKASEAGGSR
jgi:VanZ family protein